MVGGRGRGGSGRSRPRIIFKLHDLLFDLGSCRSRTGLIPLLPNGELVCAMAKRRRTDRRICQLQVHLTEHSEVASGCGRAFARKLFEAAPTTSHGFSDAGARSGGSSQILLSPAAGCSTPSVELHCSACHEKVRCTHGGSLPRRRPASKRQHAARIKTWPNCWTKSSRITSVPPATEASRRSSTSAGSTPGQGAFWGALPGMLLGGASELVSSSGRD